MNPTRSLVLAGLGLATLAAGAHAQTLRITPDEPLTIRFFTPTGATPTPNMLYVDFGAKQAGGTGERVAEISDEGAVLGEHRTDSFGGHTGPLVLGTAIVFRTADSPYTFGDSVGIDMSTLIDGSGEGQIIWSITSGFLEIDTSQVGVVWGEGTGSSSHRVSNPAPTILKMFVGGTGPCPADLDGDGVLTIFDFLEFQNLFVAGDPIADFDGDGELTLFDFLAFQNAFDAGCP